ncbi:MAG: PDZ domain-containing protein [Proteobacteria bacterium]|nr:PDZ domain-containing protein [Pseudomonadota bacterium]
MSKSYHRLIIIALVIMGLTAPVFGQNSADEARKHLVRGMVAIEMAKSEGELAAAAAEFKKATELAPTMPAAWYNLGSVQSKMGLLKDAIASYRRYLIVAPKANDARLVNDEIIKLEYRLERIEKVAELAGVWLVGTTTFAVSVNNAEFIAKGSVGTDGVTVISDGGALVGKQGRTPRGNSEMVFKGRINGFSIKGMRYRGPFTEGVSDCTIPGDQSEFTGTVSEDGNNITLNFQKGLYQADRDAGIFFGLDSCTGVTKTGDMPQTYVLTRHGGVPGKTDSAGKKLKNDIGLVGLKISETDPQLIADVLQGLPAAEAGIKIGDRVLKVDGKDARGLTIQQLVGLIRGQVRKSNNLR